MQLRLQKFQIFDFYNQTPIYLTSLHYFSLDSSNLSGSILESLSNFTHTEYLFIKGNSLNGTIPSWIFSLPSLSYLDRVLTNCTVLYPRLRFRKM